MNASDGNVFSFALDSSGYRSKNTSVSLNKKKKKTFILHSSRGQGVHIKVMADPVSGGSPLPGLETTTFILCLHMVETEGKLSGLFF